MGVETLFAGIMLIAAIAGSISTMNDRLHRKQRTAVTRGEVIGHAPNPGRWTGGRHQTAHAVVRYIVNGAEYRFVSTIGASFIIHDVGSEQEVRFDPTDPRNADINSHTAAAIQDGLCLLMPAIAVACGWWLFNGLMYG